MKCAVWGGVLVLVTTAVAAGQPLPSGRSVPLIDAVRTAISRHPALAIQQRVIDVDDAVRRQAASAFDPLIETGVERGRLYSPINSLNGIRLSPNDTSQVVGSYSRMLRSGIAVIGSLDVRRQIETPSFREGLTTSSTRVEVVFPLMRGRGTDVATAAERAAGLLRDGSVLELRHEMARVMARVVSSYWGLVAARRNREVSASSAERGALLVDNTRALIAADQSPRGDLASALANVADREAARFVSEQAYIVAHQQLVLDMGYRPDELTEGLSLEDFDVLGALPDVSALPLNPDPSVTAALERRADYAAAQRRVDSARQTRDAARNGLMPQVDFSLNVGYTTLAEGRAFSTYFSAVAANGGGADVFGRISYRFPARNTLAVARLDQAEAQFQQATLFRDELARTIRSSVLVSYSGLRNALLRLARARESVAAFDEALRGEEDKLALGNGSIVNLLSIEDRLTAAAEREVAAYRSYAQALVEFRFATGTLVPAVGDVPALDIRTFTTLPSLDATAVRSPL
jgi:outer membrane protein TolC